MKIPLSVWLAGGAALYLYWKRNAIMGAPARAGEAISSGLFDLLNPALSKERFNAPTIVDAVNTGDGQGLKCPKGYTLKFGNGRQIQTGNGWYCLRNN